MTEEANLSASPASDGQREPRKTEKRPQGGGRQTRPLTPAEVETISSTVQRVPGLGRIILDLLRNRDARVYVPETPLGKEFYEIVSEYDRLAGRSATLLTRSLSVENMQLKADFDMRALGLMDPMAQLTAELALKFDNPQNPIARHSRVKAIIAKSKAPKSDVGAETPAESS